MFFEKGGKAKTIIENLEKGKKILKLEYVQKEEMGTLVKALQTMHFEIEKLEFDENNPLDENFTNLIECLKQTKQTLTKLVVDIYIETQDSVNKLSALFESQTFPNLKELEIKFKRNTPKAIRKQILGKIGNLAIEKLSFSAREDSGWSCVVLSELISRNETISELKFESDDCEPNETDKDIFAAIENNQKIKKVSFRDLNIQDLLFQNNSTLEMLRFVSCKFSNNALRNLGRFLSKNTSLTNLDLLHCAFEECLFMDKKYFSNKTLKSVLFCHSNFGEKGSKRISEFLKNNTCLTELNFYLCEIGESANHILDALKTKNRVAKLNLSNNRLGEHHAKKIGEILATNDCLEDLDVARNELDNQVSSIFNSLKDNKTLKVLDCERTFGCNRGNKPEIAELIKVNTTLTKLNISCNEIRTKDAREIFDALSHNSSLTEIDISYTSIKSKAFSRLASMLERNTSLTTINAEDIFVENKEARLLLKAMKRNCSIKYMNLQFEFGEDLFGGKEMGEIELQMKKEILINMEIWRRDKQVRPLMMILQKRRDGNLVSKLPRRLLIYLLSFLDRSRVDKSSLREKREREEEEKNDDSKKRRLD